MDFPSSSTHLYWLADAQDPGEGVFAADIPDLVSANSLLLAGLFTPSALTSMYYEANAFALSNFGSQVSLSTLRHTR